MQNLWANNSQKNTLFTSSKAPAPSTGSIFSKKSEGAFPQKSAGLFTKNQGQSQATGIFPKSQGASGFPKSGQSFGGSQFPAKSSSPSIFNTQSAAPQSAFPGPSKSPLFSSSSQNKSMFPTKSQTGAFPKAQGDQSKSMFSSSSSGQQSSFATFPKKQNEQKGGMFQSSNQGNLFKPKGSAFPQSDQAKALNSKQPPAIWGQKSSSSPFNKPAQASENNEAPKRALWGDKPKSEFVPHVTKPPASANEPKIEEVPPQNPSPFGKPSQLGGGLFEASKSKPASGWFNNKSSEQKKENAGETGASPFSKPAAQVSSIFSKPSESNLAQPKQSGSNPFEKKQALFQPKKSEESKTIFNLSKDTPAKSPSLFKSNNQPPSAPEQKSSTSSSLFKAKPSNTSWQQSKQQEQPKPQPQAVSSNQAQNNAAPAQPKVATDIFSKMKKPETSSAAPSEAAAAAKKKEEYQPPQAVMSQKKEPEVQKEDHTDYYKKLRLKEYVRLMRDMLFLKGPSQFTEVVEMVDRTQRKVERLLDQQEVLTQQINQWISKRKEFQDSLYHQEQMLDSILSRTRDVIAQIQELDAFAGMEHIFNKIKILLDADLENDEDLDPSQLLYPSNVSHLSICQSELENQPLSTVVSEDQFNAMLRDLIVGNGEEKCLSSIKILMMYEQSERIRQELNTVSTTLGSGLHRKLQEWSQAKNQGYLQDHIKSLQLFNRFYSQLDLLNNSIETNQENLREAIRIKQKLDAQGHRISTLFP